jgi:2'-hydroxyisoflavone reductase
MHILVIVGTRFLGRALVDAALGHGHSVTLFNRGKTNPGLYPGLELIRGDRRTDADRLSGRTFDAVADVAGMQPGDVGPSVEALRGSVGRYVFISTVSVYADHSGVQAVGDPVLSPAEDLSPGDAYGAGKAAAEQVITDTFGDRALVVRPGLIVGPQDPTDRFAYWPRRIARGGRVLAPGGPDHPAQFIDARDLADWVIRAVEDGRGGTFNATGTPTTLGHVLRRCQKVVTASESALVWVPNDELLSAGVDPWMGVPLWIAVPGWEGASSVDISEAVVAGLCFRPLDETIRDTLAWDLARGGPEPGKEGLAAERETELLAALAPG